MNTQHLELKESLIHESQMALVRQKSITQEKEEALDEVQKLKKEQSLTLVQK